MGPKWVLGGPRVGFGVFPEVGPGVGPGGTWGGLKLVPGWIPRWVLGWVLDRFSGLCCSGLGSGLAKPTHRKG